MRIGYACILLKEETYHQRTCTQKYATNEKLEEIIQHNLEVLMKILQYNVQHHITMFRISSDLIPFGSSPINTLPWLTMFKTQFLKIGNYVKTHNVRVSLHPGQYTIINAERSDVVMRAIEDLEYHCAILDAMGLDGTHKLILHVGGVYQDKAMSMQRFIENYQKLSNPIKRRLVIENDDRYYAIDEVLCIANQLHIPVIFDNLHHAILPPQQDDKTITEWLSLVAKTWNLEDGVMKVHYSEQAENKRIGAHALRVHVDAFLKFFNELSFDIDIMLEVKDKNLSAQKIQYLLNEDSSFYAEWDFYQYLFYLHSLVEFSNYERQFIQHLEIDRYAFYKLSEQYQESEVSKENYLMLFQFLKKEYYERLSLRCQKLFDQYIKKYRQGEVSALQCIEGFKRMAQRENLKVLENGLLIF